MLAIDRVYGNGDGAVDQAEWDGALHLMQVLNALVAVRADQGQPKELWRMTKGLPEVASPLLYHGLLYLLRDGGILSVVNPEDGRIGKQERLSGAAARRLEDRDCSTATRPVETRRRGFEFSYRAVAIGGNAELHRSRPWRPSFKACTFAMMRSSNDGIHGPGCISLKNIDVCGSYPPSRNRRAVGI